jgi:hypothetical protein
MSEILRALYATLRTYFLMHQVLVENLKILGQHTLDQGRIAVGDTIFIEAELMEQDQNHISHLAMEIDSNWDALLQFDDRAYGGEFCALGMNPFLYSP